MGSACREIREDTEKQLHLICSMVEDIAKITHHSEMILTSKVPMIDHFYASMTDLNLKVD
jgi:hypothetical protein